MLRKVFPLASAAALACHAPSREPLRIAAASSLGEVLTELAAAYEKKTGVHVDVALGASEQLARQVEAGAPYDLFASADVEILKRLERVGKVESGSVRPFARGTLVLWTRGSAPISVADLAGPAVKRIAIANPEVAPYGRAAREALLHAGLAANVEAKIVRGESVQQAWRFAETGEVDVALVALSVVRRGEGHTTLVDPSLYAPIEEGIGIVHGAPRDDRARAFEAFLTSPEGARSVEAHGLAPPSSSTDAMTR